MNNLRVMFQGGGAHVVVLMAAAEALESIAADRHDLRIVQAAGVSAGAIAASALASADSVTEIRNRLASSGRKFLDKEGDNIASILNGDFGFNFNTAATIKKVAAGQSIIANKSLNALLSETFQDQTREMTLAQNPEMRLTVFVTDLIAGASVALDSLLEPDTPLIESIHKSVQLPFAFSTFNTGTTTDGGITGNLPIQYFGNDQESDGKVLALHFAPQRSHFGKTPVQYMRALLSSAMNASVREAVSQTIAMGGAACLLDDHDIETLEFEKAVQLAEDKAAYELLVRDLKDQLGVKLDELFSGPDITRSTKRVLEDSTLHKVHQSLIAAHPYSKLEAIQAQVMGGARHRRISEGKVSDRIHIAVKYDASSTNGLRAILLGLPFGQTPLPLLKLNITDKQKTSVKFHSELFSFPMDNGDVHRRLLVFFDEIISPERCPVTLTTSFDFAAFELLESDGLDMSRSRMVLPRPTKKVWVLVTPDTVDLEYTCLSCDSVLSDAVEHDYREPDCNETWSHGQELQGGNAAKIFDEYFFEELQPDAKFSGWLVEDFSPDTVSGFHISNKNYEIK